MSYSAHLVEPDPKTCGNPVFPSTGLKTQPELSYISVSNGLQFTRKYRSDFRTFLSPANSGLSGNSSAGVVSGGCYAGTYTKSIPDNAEVAYCFPYLTYVAPDRSINVVAADDKKLIFYGPVGGITAKADVNDKLSQRLNSAGAAEWILRRENGDTEVYGANGKLLRDMSADGRRDILYTYSDVTTPATVAPSPGLLLGMRDQFGRAIVLTYGNGSRLATLVDPAGSSLAYTYDAEGNLASASYPDGHVRSYFYNEAANVNGGAVCSNLPAGLPGALTGIAYNGARFADFKYACDGTAVSTEHAGAALKYSFNYGPNSTVVTDPLGSVRTFRFSQSLDVVRLTGTDQPAGSGCNASTSAVAYDGNGNISSKDDFDGNRTCYATDLARNLEIARVEGLSSGMTCGNYTTANAVLTAPSRKISSQWHPDFRFETRRAEPAKLTTRVYHGQPDPFNGGAIASCAPSSALLPDGKPLAVLCRQVEQATTDSDGHLGFGAALQTGVASRIQQWTYNQYGQVLSTKGARTDVDDTTTYAYYAASTSDYTIGDLSQVTNPAGHSTRFPKYNQHGQLLRSIDPNGVVTDNTYDAMQRLRSSTVAGETILYAYDSAGQLTQITQPDMTTIIYEYDAAHRLTKVTDQAGNSVTYALDGAGNRTLEQIKDPAGNLTRTMTRAVDALGRVQQVTGASQ